MGTPWRPPQWQQQSPAKVIITFPGQPQSGQYSNSSGSGITLPSAQTLYAFDAEFVIDHQQEITKTKLPIQTGASVSDHAFIEPARLILDIGMSDAIAAYYNPSTWQGSQSKSVSAYQTMLALAFARIPVTVTTRLRTYQNMLLIVLNPRDTSKQIQGLRARIVFEQLFIANVTSTPASARPQDTQSTNLGSVNAQPPTSTQQSQNNVSGLSNLMQFMGIVPSTAVGAGSWSSVNTNNLTSLPPGK